MVREDVYNPGTPEPRQENCEFKASLGNIDPIFFGSVVVGWDLLSIGLVRA